MRVALALALLLAAPAAAAPARVASLNLCTDELALLLAAPGQLMSVSRLGADAHETTLAARARGLALNNGRLGDVLGLRPDLVLTMGAKPQDVALAKAMGVRLLALPYPASLADVAAQVRAMAGTLGREQAAAPWLAELAALQASAPRPRAGLMLGGGGVAPASAGLAGQWLRLAGVMQQGGGTVALETLVAQPPPLLIMSQYRTDQLSRPQAWARHPALAALPASTRRISTDGRPWLCAGPALLPEIRRLRAAVAG
ncbi:MAG: hypothetical protein WCO82_05040 [Sphingomonadales bacterium]